MTEMSGWKSEKMGQFTKIDSDHSVLCGIDRLVKLTNRGYSILDIGCYHGDVYDMVAPFDVDGLEHITIAEDNAEVDIMDIRVLHDFVIIRTMSIDPVCERLML